jgi:D-lactate dehydrogenase (cytochrome)
VIGGLGERDVERIERRLCEAVGRDQVSRNPTVLMQHGTDESFHRPQPPDLVAYPRTTAEVAAIVRCCTAAGVPVIPFGAGTSLEGHVAAVRGGVCVDMSRMSEIVDVRVDDLQATVQAGLTRLALERALGPLGVFFPVDPGADATLGGMVATGASGTMAVRYGTMRERVVALEVVTAAGDVMRTRSRAPKSSAGYDLTHLFVGSEGTLGIVTEVTLRLEPIPEAMAAAVCHFATVEDAVGCVTDSVHSGLRMARIELLDEVQVDAVNRRSGLGLVVAPTLFAECHGSPAAVSEEAEGFAAIAVDHGGRDVAWTTDPTRRASLWRARHDAYPSAVALRPGCRGIPSDVCVPMSQLAACLGETRRDIDDAGIVAPIVGHVGDGNFHVLFILDPESPAEIEEYRRLNDRLIRRAIAMGGTCSGEHGVGYGKARYLQLEHGESAVGLMRTIKRALDPSDLMNPGKILPPEELGANAELR